MILNIIEPNACNSMCMRKPTQVKIQEYLQEEVKRKGLPPIDFNFPFNTWLNQIPDKYKIKISKDTRILSACYGEEKELKDEKRNFAGTLLERIKKALLV